VAFGLQYAFRSGLIHRDIKPGNILIDRHGTAKLLDLGLARFYHDQTDILTIKYDDKVVLGTADYVAPEQVANSHSVDVRADIYALGASFYFLLAGHPPFPTGAVSQKLLWHRTKDPTPLRQIRPEVPEGLVAIVARMMQKDPAARYQTPQEVADELERWLPNQIPLPFAEEMPKLSPAAEEMPEVTLTQLAGTGDVVIDLKPNPISEGSPFGASSSPTKFGPSPFGVGSGVSSNVLTAPFPLNSPSRSQSSKVVPNTPLPRTSTRRSRAGTLEPKKAALPDMTRQPFLTASGRTRLLILGLTVISVVSVGLLIYKSFVTH
jgi:serine/threonine protein kinase